MLGNTNILMVRHGEKPDEGHGLSPAGEARARAYVNYFRNYTIDGRPVRLQYLFATADSHASHRPRLTLEPLSHATGLEIDDKYADKEYAHLVHHLRSHDRYDGADILVCWHHGEILDLAAVLGASAQTLPASSTWPVKWPGSVFGWVLQLCHDADGALIPARTVCLNEHLMPGDRMDPPGPPAGG